MCRHGFNTRRGKVSPSSGNRQQELGVAGGCRLVLCDAAQCRQTQTTAKVRLAFMLACSFRLPYLLMWQKTYYLVGHLVDYEHLSSSVNSSSKIIEIQKLIQMNVTNKIVLIYCQVQFYDMNLMIKNVLVPCSTPCDY